MLAYIFPDIDFINLWNGATWFACKVANFLF